MKKPSLKDRADDVASRRKLDLQSLVGLTEEEKEERLRKFKNDNAPLRTVGQGKRLPDLSQTEGDFEEE